MYSSPVFIALFWGCYFWVNFVNCMDYHHASTPNGGGVLPPRTVAEGATAYGDDASGEDIRCFCNLPQCISTGYMCRTTVNGNNSGCFSEIKEPSENAYNRHGCVDLLKSIDNRLRCERIPRKYNNANKNVLAPSIPRNLDALLLCCQKDMCNHIDIPQHRKVEMKIAELLELSNSIHLQQSSQMVENNIGYSIQSSSTKNVSDDVWFRIATIAVPICGAVILFSLITTAIKILRSERMESASSSKLDGPRIYDRKLLGGTGCTGAFNSGSKNSGRGGGGAGGIRDSSGIMSETIAAKSNYSYPLLTGPTVPVVTANMITANETSGQPQSTIMSATLNKLSMGGHISALISEKLDKKNETRATINQMYAEYKLIPQKCENSDLLIKENNLNINSTNTGATTKTTCPSSLNYNEYLPKNVNNSCDDYDYEEDDDGGNHDNVNKESSSINKDYFNFNKNNNLNTNHNNNNISKNNKDNFSKIYNKEVLSPITLNWSDNDTNINNNNTSNNNNNNIPDMAANNTIQNNMNKSNFNRNVSTKKSYNIININNNEDF